ncbi:MarR family winged helix-turn-helix transcriptional regulator [Indioceanicola profundi]|uniref:MarR family winged helix-turn-helix transcriptional regulator n=1 Tax=Indioceanicola profundi TaxID=2220096 RepID=UPI00298DC293|nr:MarR family transcriptional regulator [Indioceanicola profundi]
MNALSTAAELIAATPSEDRSLPEQPGRQPTMRLYHDLARLIERLHRRFLDVVRIELARLGVEDISPVQALMVMTIGTDELSVRDLIERGYYLGSNASYNLKHLVEAGFVERTQSQRDRRSARLSLSPRGLELCAELKRMEAGHIDSLIRAEQDGQDVEATYRTLRRLERTWTDVIRYHGLDYP